MAKRTRKAVTATSSRAEHMRTLDLGGARGNYGFGRYPEGVFASVRHMVHLRANTKSDAQLVAEVEQALGRTRKVR